MWLLAMTAVTLVRVGCQMRDIMGMGWACASTNTTVILQEAGGGGMLGKAMGLHMAAVMPTHSAHMICLEDQCEAATPRSPCVCCLTGT